MDISAFLMAGGLMLGIGVVLSTLLALANKKLYVFEDPRIEQVEAMLPHANCGACGGAGCRGFAEQLVEGKVSPGKCTANSPEAAEAIAKLLGVDAGTQEKQVARLACAGGNHVARMQAVYEGLPTCWAATIVGGGGKGCAWGCLGFGDCKDACIFRAIEMDDNRLPVVDETRCTGCGACVQACPKQLFSLHPISHRLWVACKNELPGPQAEPDCEVACIGCGRCAMDAAPGLITIERNLSRIHYEKNAEASLDAIQRCPTGAIVWLDEEKGPVKGPAAKKVRRKAPVLVG